MNKPRICSLATVLVVLSSTPAFASFGLVGGVDHPELGDVSNGGVSSGTGGAVVELGIADNLLLHTELRFVDLGVGTGTYDLLALPVLAQLNFPLGPLKPHLQTGPDFQFKLSGDGFNSTNFAWDFGAGVGLDLFAVSFFLDVRYSLGLSNVVDVPGADVKTKTWELLVGVLFGI